MSSFITTAAEILEESSEYHDLGDVLDMHNGNVDSAVDYLIEEATTSHELPNADTPENRKDLRAALERLS